MLLHHFLLGSKSFSIKQKRRGNDARPKQNLTKPCRHVNGYTTSRLLYASTCRRPETRVFSITRPFVAYTVMSAIGLSGHRRVHYKCPLITQSGHCGCNITANSSTSGAKI